MLYESVKSLLNNFVDLLTVRWKPVIGLGISSEVRNLGSGVYSRQIYEQ